jgi:hypothetical protein
MKTETWNLYVENGAEGGYCLNVGGSEVKEAANYDNLLGLVRDVCDEKVGTEVVNEFILGFGEDVKLGSEEKQELELLVDAYCV